MNGCRQMNCPCRTWVQCWRYNNKVWKDIHPEQINEEIHEWYNTNFRLKYSYPDIIGNG